MKHTVRLAAAVMATAALTSSAALADTAAAKAPVKATSASAVGKHLRSAQKATSRLTSQTRRGDARAARRSLHKARHEAVVAARTARALSASATSDPAAAKQAVWSLSAAAGGYGDAVKSFGALVPSADGALQQAIAAAIPGSIAGRDQLVAQLATLVTQLSGDAQALAAQALAALQQGGPAQVQDLAQVATIDGLPALVSGIINQALTAATAALNTGLAQLTSVFGALPAEAQGPVTAALQTVQTALQAIVPLIQSTTQAVLGTVQSVLGMVTHIIGAILPSGQTGAGSSATPGPSGGLLGGLTNLVPGFGGLLGHLLGGFLPVGQ